MLALFHFKQRYILQALWNSLENNIIVRYILINWQRMMFKNLLTRGYRDEKTRTCPDQTPRLESSSFGEMVPAKQSQWWRIYVKNLVHCVRKVGEVTHSNYHDRLLGGVELRGQPSEGDQLAGACVQTVQMCACAELPPTQTWHLLYYCRDFSHGTFLALAQIER